MNTFFSTSFSAATTVAFAVLTLAAIDMEGLVRPGRVSFTAAGFMNLYIISDPALALMIFTHSSQLFRRFKITVTRWAEVVWLDGMLAEYGN